MTVYELIQELTKFQPDSEVNFHVEAEFDTDEADNITFDDNVDLDDIRTNYLERDSININLKY